MYENKDIGLSVLIVDDEANIRKTLTVCLDSSGRPTWNSFAS
jgi:CheY-like chemotaxis protein